MEKSSSQLFLERRQSGAGARRANTQITGCGADAPELRDAQEQVQVIYFHFAAFNDSLKLILNETRYREQLKEIK
ncbi:hypothetical protein [Sphingopyxis chilensis]